MPAWTSPVAGATTGRDPSDLGGPDDTGPPSGSQRGLAILRQAADEAAAERRRYVRLASTAPGLAAPEQAVVAAFERIDLVVADPVAEIVDGTDRPRPGPRRPLVRPPPARPAGATSWSDRVRSWSRRTWPGASHRTRSPGPAARSLYSRSGSRLARHGGLTADRISFGAFPTWLLDEREPAARADRPGRGPAGPPPDHPLAFEAPEVGFRVRR